VICLFCSTIAAAGSNKGTLEQQEACTPDAFRLCGQYIPNPAKVESCLRGSKLRLSPACRLVFDPESAAK